MWTSTSAPRCSRAWARWEATTNKGRREGVGIYRVQGGKLTYYQDYMNEMKG